jgi:hypothetical protein
MRRMMTAVLLFCCVEAMAQSHCKPEETWKTPYVDLVFHECANMPETIGVDIPGRGMKKAHREMIGPDKYVWRLDELETGIVKSTPVRPRVCVAGVMPCQQGKKIAWDPNVNECRITYEFSCNHEPSWRLTVKTLAMWHRIDVDRTAEQVCVARHDASQGESICAVPPDAPLKLMVVRYLKGVRDPLFPIEVWFDPKHPTQKITMNRKQIDQKSGGKAVVYTDATNPNLRMVALTSLELDVSMP